MPGPGSIALSKQQQADGGRYARKKAKVTAEEKAERDCYRHVNERDKRICRVCQAQTSAQGGLLHGTIHHHLIYRSGISVQAGRHATWNVLTICPDCNDAIHTKGTLKLEGDADLRDKATGKLCGVKVERPGESGWRVEKWC